jgi:hypothetical protein
MTSEVDPPKAVSPLYRFGTKLIERQLPEGVRGLALTISYNLYILELQSKRIRQSMAIVKEKQHYSTLQPQFDPYFTLLADTHLYVIAWTNIEKSLRQLARRMNDRRLNWIYSRRQKWFARMRLARNHLEHMDERSLSSGQVTHTPRIIRIAGRRTAVVFDTRVEIGESSFHRIAALSDELDRWLSKFPSKYSRRK